MSYHLKDFDKYKKDFGLVEEEGEPVKTVDIGEKYELITGIPEDEAGGVDPKLLPNLHRKWIPGDNARPYNDKLYKDANEQEFYESFVQPLYKALKGGKARYAIARRDGFSTHHWEQQINIDALGPEKALFQDKTRKYLDIGEIEITLILAVHFMDDLTRYGYSRIAKRFGCSIDWIKRFRKRIQAAYGKMFVENIEDYIEKQMCRCEGILDTFLTKARDGDPIAAKVVKEYMEKEDRYIIPTLEQLPAKSSDEERTAAINRLKDMGISISFNKRGEIEDKHGK